MWCLATPCYLWYIWQIGVAKKEVKNNEITTLYTEWCNGLWPILFAYDCEVLRTSLYVTNTAQQMFYNSRRSITLGNLWCGRKHWFSYEWCQTYFEPISRGSKATVYSSLESESFCGMLWSEGDKKRFFLDNTDWRNRAKEKRKRCALLESRGKEAEKTMDERKKTRRKGRF